MLNINMFDAKLQGAQLQRADMSAAQIQGAFMREAQLQGAFMWGAQLQRSILGGILLDGAFLESADLSNTLNLTIEQPEGACTEGSTWFSLELMEQLLDLKGTCSPG